MRPGLVLVGLLSSVLLAATGTVASGRPQAGGNPCWQAPCLSNAVEPSSQCSGGAAAGSLAGCASQRGGMCAMMLLQRQAIHSSVAPPALETAYVRSGLTLPPVSLMTLASAASETRPNTNRPKMNPRDTKQVSKRSRMIHDEKGDQEDKDHDTRPATKRSRMSEVKEEYQEEGEADEDDEEEADDAKVAPSKDGKRIEETAALNEKGYKMVVKTHSDKRMRGFVRRIIAAQGLYILDEGSLHGLVPYYSGSKAKQSFQALSKEIKKIARIKENPWLSTKEPKRKRQAVSLTDTKKESPKDIGIEALASLSGKEMGPVLEEKPRLQDGDNTAMKEESGQRASMLEEEPRVQDGGEVAMIEEIFPSEMRVPMPAEDGHKALIQQRIVPSEKRATMPEEEPRAQDDDRKRRDERISALVQTDSRPQSSSGWSWIPPLLGVLHGEAVYWFAARITMLVCAGSFFYGLLLFDESAHQRGTRAWAAALEPEGGLSRSSSVPFSESKDRPVPELRDLRPGALSPRPPFVLGHSPEPASVSDPMPTN